jgi:hypothetical protein
MTQGRHESLSLPLGTSTPYPLPIFLTFTILFFKALINPRFSNPLLPIGDSADSISLALSALQD